MSSLLLSALLLLVERVTYVWVCRRPAAFAQRVEQFSTLGPSVVLSFLFGAFKVIQVSVFGWWCWMYGDGSLVAPIDSIERLASVVAGIALAVSGQMLNVRVFQLLGPTGVFYGNRFGLTSTWCTAFPFSVLSHPQYVGTCLSIWGLFLVARCPHADWYVLPVLESVYYAVGASLER